MRLQFTISVAVLLAVIFVFVIFVRRSKATTSTPLLTSAENLGSADDLRAAGWAVAVHNDYMQDAQPHTFWLMTKGSQAVKGEGTSDAEALNQIRQQIESQQ